MALLSLGEIKSYIRNKTNEQDNVFFTDEILNEYINTTLAIVCEEALIYERLAKSLIEEPTDGIYLPEDFIDVVEVYVNNKRYTKKSFGDIKFYVGEYANRRSDRIYYIRNNKMIFLTNQSNVITDYALKENDELTIYYYAYYPKLQSDTDTIQGEFRRNFMKDLISNKVISLMLEQDEDENRAAYYLNNFQRMLFELKKRNRFRQLGEVRMRCKGNRSSQNFIYEDF